MDAIVAVIATSPRKLFASSGGGMRLAIHAPNLGLSLPEQPFGKDVANRGLYTALATHGGFEQISFCTAENPPLAICSSSLEPHRVRPVSTFHRSCKRMQPRRPAPCSAVSPISPNWPGSGAIAMAIRPTAWWG